MYDDELDALETGRFNASLLSSRSLVDSSLKFGKRASYQEGKEPEEKKEVGGSKKTKDESNATDARKARPFE